MHYLWVTGIQGKREWEQKMVMGTCKNYYSSLDSLPVKFTELCKPIATST